MSETSISIADATALASAALRAHGLRAEAAEIVAGIYVDAERDGIASHGLARIPNLCTHLAGGRIRGDAVPQVSRPRPGLIRADAAGGFPQPAFEAAFDETIAAVRELGIACLSVCNGWAADVMGWHAERFASEGFLALGFANVPAAISPAGGARPVFGTNPITCAVPRPDGPPIVIDQASSVVAKSEVVQHAAAGKPIPEGWALDAEGRPTIDARAALAGSMVPFGGYKGVGIAFIVELFAAVVSGSELSIEAPPLAGRDAPPVRIGQTYVVVDPAAMAGDGWLGRIGALAAAIESQPGARIPGAKRFLARTQAQAEGLHVPASLMATLEDLASHTRS